MTRSPGLGFTPGLMSALGDTKDREGYVAGRIYRRNVDLLEADLGEELVALEPNAGECFGFNTVAASVWRELEQPRSFEDLRDALLDQYDVDDEQCARELSQLLEDLTGRGLVKTSG